MRAALPNRIKVSTAEPWSTWLLNPDLGRYVDFITVHLLPYWEGVDVHGALMFDQHAIGHIRNEFPDKPIVIGETGWPSEGRTRVNAEASLANQAYYIRNFVQLAMEKGYDYYLLEAYDQPWKNANEGAVGAYWGLFDANGRTEIPLHRHAAHLPRMAHLCAGRGHPHAAAGPSDPRPHAARAPAGLSRHGRARGAWSRPASLC